MDSGARQDNQARLDGLLIPAEGPVETGEPEGEKKGGLPTWAIILIAVVVILCLIPFCVIAILTLLGPSIGSVFSNIVDQL
ncbi:MAG: hypothetical protein P8Z40_17335 [Chloroflexota bacterium]